MPTTIKAKKPKPSEVVRASVYLPAPLHSALVKATDEIRDSRRAQAVNRRYGRTTLSDTIIDACTGFIAGRKPRRKAA